MARFLLSRDLDAGAVALTTDPPGGIIPEDVADVLRDRRGPTGGGASFTGSGVMSMTIRKGQEVGAYLESESHKVRYIDGAPSARKRSKALRLVCAECGDYLSRRMQEDPVCPCARALTPAQGYRAVPSPDCLDHGQTDRDHHRATSCPACTSSPRHDAEACSPCRVRDGLDPLPTGEYARPDRPHP